MGTMLTCAMTIDLSDTPAIQDWLLPYEEQLEQRLATQIDLVVIHCTELPDLAMAREYGERELHSAGTGNSGHYYIDRDGRLVMFVRPTHVAHHTRGYNARSVGIEIVNTGRYPHWFDSHHQEMTEPYTAAQIHSLNALLKWLKGQLPNLKLIAGHEDLDIALVPASDNPTKQVFRKRDPGPLFPWDTVLQACELERFNSNSK